MFKTAITIAIVIVVRAAMYAAVVVMASMILDWCGFKNEPETAA